MSKTIFGQVETADGSAVSNGQIIFNLKGSVSQPGIGVLAPKTIACALPSNGVFSQPLIANDELSPGGSSYAVTVLDATGHQILSKVSVFAGVSPIPVVVFQDNNPANSSTGWYANTPVTNDAINLPPSLYAGGPPLETSHGWPISLFRRLDTRLRRICHFHSKPGRDRCRVCRLRVRGQFFEQCDVL